MLTIVSCVGFLSICFKFINALNGQKSLPCQSLFQRRSIGGKGEDPGLATPGLLSEVTLRPESLRTRVWASLSLKTGNGRLFTVNLLRPLHMSSGFVSDPKRLRFQFP